MVGVNKKPEEISTDRIDDLRQILKGNGLGTSDQDFAREIIIWVHQVDDEIIAKFARQKRIAEMASKITELSDPEYEEVMHYVNAWRNGRVAPEYKPAED